MPLYTFAYRHLDREWHRGEFGSGLRPEDFGEALIRMGINEPTDEIRVWEGRDTERTPDAVVQRRAV